MLIMVFAKRVIVPAFVNPHLFWIFEIENTEQRQRFHEKLNENLRNPTRINAQQGELVVIFDNKTWKRAEVLAAFEGNYDCWLIDYGSLCKVASVYKLPVEFTITPAMVHMACLNNIIEAPAVLEIETGNHIRQEVVHFSQGLSTFINTLIFDAESIVFHTQRVIDHVLCGKMQLTKNGISYNLTDKLFEEKRIAVNEELFREAFEANNRGLMHLRNYKIFEAQKKESPLVVDGDIGIGRGYNRSNRNKQPSLRSPEKNFVQTWVEESNAQLISDRKLSNAAAISHGASTSKGAQKLQNQLTTNNFNSTLNSDYVDPDKLYEDADDITTLNTTQPSKCKSRSSVANSSSSFEDSKLKVQESISKAENEETRSTRTSSRAKSKLNRSFDSVSDDYFETIEVDDPTKKLQSKLHDSIADNFFESVDDDKRIPEIKNGSFKRDENQKSPSHKPERIIDDADPFSTSDEDSSAESKGIKKSSLIKQAVNSDHPSTDFDGDSLKKSENGEARNESSMSSKLPGFSIYPAGISLAHPRRNSKVTSRSQSTSRSSTRQNKNIKHRKVTSKPPGAVPLSKSSGSSVSTSSDAALKNKDVPQPIEETLNAVSSDSDSECAPEPPCKKNLFQMGCKCENCRMWNEDDIVGENNKYKDSRNVTKREIVRPSLLFKTKDAEDAVEIKTKKFKGTKIERDMAPTLLVHGFCVPAPVSKINEVPFNASVLRALTKLKYSSAKSIQSYAWPALMRHMNVCMVHGADTGKTMAYLPAICSYVLELSERYADLPKTSGPVAIILCKGVRKVEETYSLFCNFRAQVGKRININWAASPLDNNSLKSIQTSDVLVATPTVLITLLTRRVITLKRLCHFVVEEADQVLSKFPQEFDDLTDVVQSMLKHRSCIYSVQVVLCSEHWTVSLEKFVKKLYSVPLICIGAYLESALYGRADIQMHFVQSKVKLSMLCGILKETSHIRRTVIVCKEEDEIDALEEHLRIKGVSVASVKSTMVAEEVLEVELMWANTICGKHVALICKDALLHGQLSITSANVLVHYSLPTDSWTQFSRRFKCLVDSYESPFNSKNFNKCQVHVFVDEACTKQFPRLYNFLQTMGAKISEKFSEFCKKIKESKELEKIEQQTKLCPILKLLGKCEKVSCKKRHLLSEQDVSTTLPQNGLIKFKLITVNDVSVYTVRLKEHTSIDGEVHKYPEDTDFGAKLSQAMKENQMYVKDPKLGGLFAWFDAENNAYHRCEIIRVLSENEITKLADDVHIKLIDTGSVKKTTTALLFELPEYYRTLPAQGIEVYLANVLPPDRDIEWSFNMRHKVEKILDKAEYQKPEAYFTGRVVLQLANTLWLEDVMLLEDLSFTNETVRKLLLKKSLLDIQLVSHKPEQLPHLYNLCKTVGIALCDDYNCKTSPIKAATHHVKQVRPQWAHLDEENLNPVYFCSGISPHQFYVRLEKFYGLFQKFQKELQSLVNQPHYPVVKKIKVGDCYLVRDPGSEDYCRAIVTDIQDETVDCFFPDFGDGACVFKNEIKHLPDCYITQLPFQAIECKLFGISSPMEVWPDEATDILYQYCFEPKNVEGCDTKSDIFRTLYVSTLSAMKSGSNGCRNYSVLLVDYFSRKPVLINKILIDCGFALPEEDISLENITLPVCQDYNDEQDDDIFSIKDEKDVVTFNDEVNGAEEVIEKSPSPSESDNVWDIEIDNAEEFLKDFMGVTKRKSGKPLRINDKAPAEAYPIKALPPAKHHTPDLTWYQTDRHIKIDIKLPNITKYALHILRKQIFTFSTTSANKEYKLNFQLYEDVEKTFQHSSGGLVIRVTLEKCNSVEWPRLTKSEQKFRYIKYDVSKCNFPEEKKRLFLEIDRDEKDEGGTDNYFVIGSDEDYSESDIESNLSDD